MPEGTQTTDVAEVKDLNQEVAETQVDLDRASYDAPAEIQVAVDQKVSEDIETALVETIPTREAEVSQKSAEANDLPGAQAKDQAEMVDQGLVETMPEKGVSEKGGKESAFKSGSSDKTPQEKNDQEGAESKTETGSIEAAEISLTQDDVKIDGVAEGKITIESAAEPAAIIDSNDGTSSVGIIDSNDREVIIDSNDREVIIDSNDGASTGPDLDGVAIIDSNDRTSSVGIIDSNDREVIIDSNDREVIIDSNDGTSRQAMGADGQIMQDEEGGLQAMGADGQVMQDEKGVPDRSADSPAPRSESGERTTATPSVEERIDTEQPFETISAAVSEASENLEPGTGLDDNGGLAESDEEKSGDIAMSSEEFAEFQDRLEEIMAEFPDGDVMASLFYIFKSSIEEQNEDKRYFLGKLADMNKIAEAQGEYLKELNAMTNQLQDSIAEEDSESGSDSEGFYEGDKYSPDWSDDYKGFMERISAVEAALADDNLQLTATVEKKVWDQAVPIQRDTNIYELTQNIILSETQDLSPEEEQEVTAVVLARTGNNVRTTVSELQKDNEDRSNKELIDKWSVLLDIESEEGETEDEQLDNAFENFDQKANQLFTILSTVMKSIKEMRESTTRNLL